MSSRVLLGFVSSKPASCKAQKQRVFSAGKDFLDHFHMEADDIEFAIGLVDV